MKQIIIRLIAPGIPVFDFCFGEITDEQFHPLDVNDLPSEYLRFVETSDLLGTQAFIRSCNLRNFLEFVIPNVSDIGYYDRFIILTLNSDYGTEEEKE